MASQSDLAASEGRLLATILFMELVGYSALADQLTPAQIRQVIGPLWEEFQRIITEYGGVVASQMGESLILVWGAPNPQEDDAERAVSASLDLQQGLDRFKEQAEHPGPKTLQLRMGIHSGLVLAGGFGVKGDFTVLGDTVHVAQLLEQSAEPGTLLVSEATYQTIRGAFQVKRLTPIQFKGTRSLMNVFQILEELPQPTKLRYRSKGGLETRLVARDAELEQLGSVFKRVLESNQPQLALIAGDVGVGKSRLLFEFIGHLETHYPLLTVMSSRALEQTSRIPNYVWRELWANRFALKEDDPSEIAQQKTIEGVRALWGRALGEITAVEAAHFLGQLIGVEWEKSPYLSKFHDQPKSLNHRGLLMLEEVFQRASQRGPVVLLLDDLHWADQGSLAVLLHLWQGTDRKIPLLILGGTRADFLGKSDPAFQSAEIINLGPVPFSADLVRDAYPILKGESEEVLTLLAKKSQGNPYFMEEMVKSVVVAGKVDQSRLQRLPDTLQDLLQSRLDLLSIEARATAYLAAVAGRAFWKGSVMASFRGAPGVTQVLGVSSANLVSKIQAALDELMQEEMAFLRVGSAFSGDREYIFKHALLQEVAYGRLPEEMKIACHLAVANWMAERVGPERSICVAYHYEKGEAFDQAQVYYTQAAEFTRSLGNEGDADDLQFYARTLPDPLSG